LKNKNSILFIIKFLILFNILYWGTFILIGISSPGNYYSPFVSQYLDYVSWIRMSLIKGASLIAQLFGFTTVYEPNYLVRVVNGRGVIIAYDCAGYGVMSFWTAFVLTWPSGLSFRLKWLLSGLIILWLINVFRIGLFLVAINKKWKMPLGIDHHTWFNIVSYFFIFTMMYYFNRNDEKRDAQKNIP
jgi:exosortase/archaeosortase family protein